MKNSNIRESGISLAKIQENITKLAGVNGYRDIAKVLEENPAYYFRFVRDLSATGVSVESLLKPSVIELGRRILRMVFTLPQDMSSGLNLAPSFSTTAAQQDKPVHSLSQRISIGGDESEETLEVACDIYANNPDSVNLKLVIARPKTLKEGDTAGIALARGGIDAPRVEVTLSDDRTGGLFGLGKFSMSWAQFVSFGSENALEVDVDLPTES